MGHYAMTEGIPTEDTSQYPVWYEAPRRIWVEDGPDDTEERRLSVSPASVAVAPAVAPNRLMAFGRRIGRRIFAPIRSLRAAIASFLGFAWFIVCAGSPFIAFVVFVALYDYCARFLH